PGPEPVNYPLFGAGAGAYRLRPGVPRCGGPCHPPYGARMSQVFKIGTRKSTMALRQTEAVIQALQQKFPEHRFEIVARPADADLDLKSRLSAMGGKGGAFITAMRAMMKAGAADMVMHSLKDLPGN